MALIPLVFLISQGKMAPGRAREGDGQDRLG